MRIHTIPIPSWSTASFGETVDTSPMELSALGEHMKLCRASCGRLFALRCAVLTLHGFVAARFVTTLAVAAFVIGVSSRIM